MIPKDFQIGGHKIKVSIKDIVKGHDNVEILGLSSLNENIINIAKSLNNGTTKLPLTTLEHTYFHELVHIILMYMNEDELNNNEKFVDTFAGHLHQILKTSKYAK
jgi:hypothetical protein